MDNRGMTIDDVENLIGDDYIKISSLELNEDDKKIVSDMIDEIVRNKEDNSYIKGQMLEKLICKILESTKIFKCLPNPKTSSNEIDVVVRLNFQGKKLRNQKLIPEWIPDWFLVECKNYSKPVEVGLIGKFYSLMQVSECSLGIFLATNGISGRENRKWENAAELVNKINLKYSSDKSIILLDLNLDDIKIVLNEGTDIVTDVIESKQINIYSDISNDIAQWIKPHENEGKLILK